MGFISGFKGLINKTNGTDLKTIVCFNCLCANLTVLPTEEQVNDLLYSY